MNEISGDKLLELLDERVERLRVVTRDVELRQQRLSALLAAGGAMLASLVFVVLSFMLNASVDGYRLVSAYAPAALGALAALLTSAYFTLRVPPNIYRSLKQEIIVARKLVGRASVLNSRPSFDRDDQLILDIKLGEAEALITWAEGLAGNTRPRGDVG
jgi:hypothetical protein